MADPDVTPVGFAATEGANALVRRRRNGIGNSVTRETIVAATNCEAVFANGSRARFRGAIQGSNVTLGNRSTVGTFKAPAGTMNVNCHQEPFGRLRSRNNLREQRPFLVASGKPPGNLLGWIGLFAGIGALFLAIPAGSRWLRGSLAPV